MLQQRRALGISSLSQDFADRLALWLALLGFAADALPAAVSRAAPEAVLRRASRMYELGASKDAPLNGVVTPVWSRSGRRLGRRCRRAARAAQPSSLSLDATANFDKFPSPSVPFGPHRLGPLTPPSSNLNQLQHGVEWWYPRPRTALCARGPARPSTRPARPRPRSPSPRTRAARLKGSLKGPPLLQQSPRDRQNTRGSRMEQEHCEECCQFRLHRFRLRKINKLGACDLVQPASVSIPPLVETPTRSDTRFRGPMQE